jgi:hypothetical protein
LLREETVQVQLLTYGRDLPAGKKEALLPRPRAFADDGSMAPSRAFERWRVKLAWRDFRRFQERIIAVGERPATELDEAFAVFETPSVLKALIPGLGNPDQVTAFARYSRRDAAAVLRLDLLVASAASREFHRKAGRWPACVADLSAAGLLEDDEARRLERMVLVEDSGGTALELMVPLPVADASPAMATVRMRAERREGRRGP